MILKVLKSLSPIKGSVAKWILVIGFIVLMIHSVLSYFKVTEYAQEVEKWKAIATRALAFADSVQVEQVKTVQFADSMKVVAAVQTSEIDRLRHEADVLSRRGPTIKWLRETLPDTCKIAIDVAEKQTVRATKLDSALKVAELRDTGRVQTIGRLTTTNGLLNISNDSLRKLVTSVPFYKEPRIIGFIPYPSRKTSFVAGAITGVVSTVIVNSVTKNIQLRP